MADRYHIRAARDSDVSQASALLSQVVSSLSYYNEDARNTEIAKFDKKGLGSFVADPTKMVLIAEASAQEPRQRLAGLLIAGEDDRLMWLNWFIVHPTHRRCGVGTQLVDALAAAAREHRCHKIWCDSRVENLPSAHLLLREGFKVIARVNNHWYGQDFYLWERSLA